MKITNPKPLSKVREVQKAKKQREQNIDKVPVIEGDVTEVAVTTAFVLEDTMTTAETVAFLLLEISNLKSEIETLKGGNK